MAAEPRSVEEAFGDVAGSLSPLPSGDRAPDTRISTDLHSMADAAAERHGLDPRFFRGVIHTESSWNPNAVGPANRTGERAIGLGQIMPSTAADEGYDPRGLYNPEVNLDASAKYLSKLLVQAGGDHHLAARMYNAGPNSDALNSPQVLAYGDRVFTNARRWDDVGDSPDIARGFQNSLSQFWNDTNAGLNGYSEASQGYDRDAAESYAAYRQRQRDLDSQVRPQDQSFTEAVRGGAKEFFGDYLPYTIGSAAGSSAPALAGAATGFAVGGPVGAVVGGALPLLAQYLGNTWADHTAAKLEKQGINPDQATGEQLYQASGLSAGDWARVTGAAAARAGAEGLGDVLLGGFGGKVAGVLLPKGAAKTATDLLSGTAARRVGSAAVGEGVTEMADVPLSDIGADRSWSGPQDYLDAFAGGAVGGGGVRSGYEVARNPGATMGAVQNGISNVVGQTQWGQNRAAQQEQQRADRIREELDAATQRQADIDSANAQAEAAAEAERNRIPTAKELHQQMLAEHEAKLKEAKLPAATEEEYYAETEKYDNPDDLPPQLATFAAYKAYRKKTDKTEQIKRNAEVGPMPTMQDALRRRQEIIRDKSPKKTYVNKATGQFDMWGNEYGKGPAITPEQESAAEDAGPDVRQGEIDFGPEPLALPRAQGSVSVEDALNRAEKATSAQEEEMWLRTAIAREEAQKTGETGQRTPPPTFRELQDLIATRREQSQSGQRAAATREAERAALSGERNQAYDALEAQQAADKEAQFADMERQRLEQDAKAQIAESNRVSPENALINGKKAPTQFKGRPSVEVQANLAALEAQNKDSAKHNTLAQKIEEAKQSMLTKAVAALKKQGALIEDGDLLQWKDRAWSLFPPNYRGRPRAGYFYADIFNDAGEKIGKVLRPEQAPPKPPEDTGNAENTAGSNSSNGKQEGQTKPRRKNSRRVSKAEGQSEANNASQGAEVTGSSESEITAEIKRLEENQTEGNLDDKDVDALIKKIGEMQERKKPLSQADQLDEAIARRKQKEAEAKQKEEAEAEQRAAAARRRKEEADEVATLNRDTSIDEDAEDPFNKGERQDGADAVKKFLTKKSLAEQKRNPTTVGDVIQHYLDTEKNGIYRGLAQLLLKVNGITETPISWTVGEPGDLGLFRRYEGTIEIHDGGGWHTVFHEAVHAATIKGMNIDPELDAVIERLWKVTKAKWSADPNRNLHYGLTSKWEFLAEAFTNPEFQDFLKTISVKTDDGKASHPVWNWLVNAVNKFLNHFGGTEKDFSTVLEMTMSAGRAAMARTNEAGTTRLEYGDENRKISHVDLEPLYHKDFNTYTEKLLDSTFGNTVGSGLDTINNLIVGLNNTAYLAKWRPDLKSLQDIHASETKMQASQGKNANAVMDKVDDIRNLQKPERTKLFTLMVDSTRERIHPDRPLSDKTNAHISATPESEAKHRELETRYNALSTEGKKAYQETRDLFQTMFDQRVKALFALGDRILTDKKAEQFKENINRLVKETPGPYFPLTRFGGYVSVWKSKEYAQAQKDHDTKAMEKLKRDPNHYQVSFHESMFQAKRALSKITQAMGDRSALGENESYAREREFYDGGVTMDLRPLLEKMQDAVETTLGKENSKDAKDALAEIFVSSLADTNVLKSALKRENIEGVKPAEMLQSIAKHGSAQAFHISRLEHMADIQDALKTLRNEDSVAVNKGERFSIYNTVAKALTGMYTGDPTSFPVRAINTANFVLYNGRLALNPAFWLTNAMAPMMVSVPYMRGRFKLNTVLDAYRTAASDAAKVVMPKGLKDATRFSLLDAITDAKGLKAGERTMLLELMDEGLIDENQIRELSNVAQGDIGWKDELSRYMGAIPHRVEALNRVSTALTAYRLELARTKDQEAAVRYALEATSETQVNYTTAGTPYILRKNGWLGAPMAKILTQFMRYQLGMNQLIVHNLREAFVSKKVDAKTREEAKRKFYALLTMHTAMTGASGWFGINAFMAVAQMVMNAFTDDDDEVDLEQEMKKLADSIFGKELSVGVRKGAPAMFGLDLSSRLGMGDMLSIRKENPFRGDVTDAKAKFVDISPALSNIFNWYDWGRSGFAIKKTPIAFVSNLAKASELASKGMVNTHGVVKKGAEDYGPTSIVAQGLGFTPTESTEAYAAQTSVRESEKRITTARQALLDDWNNAMADKDQATVADTRKKIAEFNARHKGKRDIQITQDTLTKSRKQRMARQKRMNEYGVYVPKGGEWRNDMTNAED